MVFIDWTLSTQSQSGSYACQGGGLDGTVKYSGVSSLKLTANQYTSGWSKAKHNTFLEPQAQVISWIYTQKYGTVNPRINISSYGDLTCVTSADSTWERFKVSFWYDIGSNTKWGRIERWSGSEWIQIGTDTNLGSGSPAAGTLSLISRGNTGLLSSCYSCWFDEVEVYS